MGSEMCIRDRVIGGGSCLLHQRQGGLITAVLSLERGEGRPVRRVGGHRSASDSDSSGERGERRGEIFRRSDDKNVGLRINKIFFQPSLTHPHLYLL